MPFPHSRTPAVRHGTAYVTLAAALAVLSPPPDSAVAAEFHVMTTGRNTNPGSISAPWDLQYALLRENAANPGDTIWIHEGTYAGRFYSNLDGTAERPYVVRAMPGVRASIVLPDGVPGYAVLDARSTHTVYWGLEFAVLHTNSASGSYADGVRFGPGARFNKLVNCVIRDATNSGVADQDAEGTELYGNIIVYSGRRATGGNAYAVYGQNDSTMGRKTYADNVFLHTFAGYTLHMYGTNTTVDSFTIKHNVFANTTGSAALMFSSNARGPRGVVIDSNFFFGPKASSSLYVERKGLLGPVLRGNYFVRGRLLFRASTLDRIFSGNVVSGDPPVVTVSGGLPAAFDVRLHPENTWLVGKTRTPGRGGQTVMVRANVYEPGRGMIVVYNWSAAPFAAVDLARIVPSGRSFRIVDAQNYFGPPVAVGTFSGAKVSVPMAASTIPPPVTPHPEFEPPTHTGGEFGVFIVFSP
jgi:hypothetical protein